MHELGPKTFLGSTIPAGTDGVTSLTMALDILFAHPNVAPFISRQLIQRLVCSNPSPGYIARVATVFNNDGAGVKGNLKAVLKAILLDDEARRIDEEHHHRCSQQPAGRHRPKPSEAHLHRHAAGTGLARIHRLEVNFGESIMFRNDHLASCGIACNSRLSHFGDQS
ncbi:MAG: DUF1800 family protein [Herminiimonas sp.]|nr:DUF1800 family protein [Herminiimonas sp.]